MTGHLITMPLSAQRGVPADFAHEAQHLDRLRTAVHEIADEPQRVGRRIDTASPMADLRLPDGEAIPIEERSSTEVTHVGGSRLAPTGALIWNPAFDVTPHRFIAGIITERGIFRAPYTESLKSAFEEKTLA